MFPNESLIARIVKPCNNLDRRKVGTTEIWARERQVMSSKTRSNSRKGPKLYNKYYEHKIFSKINPKRFWKMMPSHEFASSLSQF